MEKAKERAIMGGYVTGFMYEKLAEIDPLHAWEILLFDYEFWRCLGIAEGWKKYTWSSYKGYSHLLHNEETDEEEWAPKTEYAERHVTSVLQWHRLIDQIAEGGNADEFFNKILK